MALGDVLMRRHPAAALHWLPGDADQWPSANSSMRLEMHSDECWPSAASFLSTADRALVALEQPVHDAMANNGLRGRRADLQQLRRQAIQAGITVVANDQALVAVEHAQAIASCFERGVEPHIGLFERHLAAHAGHHGDEFEQRQQNDDGKKDRLARLWLGQRAVIWSASK